MSDKTAMERKEDAAGAPSNASTASPEAVYFDESKLRRLPLEHAPVAMAYAEHGVAIDHQHRDSLGADSHPELWWSKVRSKYQDVFSEFLGVFIMILFGDGVVAQVVLANGEKGQYQSITWGMIVLFHAH
jgi:hypothetical protein